MALATAGSGGGVQTFSTRAAARILAVSPDRIRYWVKRRFIQPSVTQGKQYRFAFHDLLVMRLAKELLPTRRHLEPIQRCLDRVRGFVGPAKPVTALRLSNEDGRIVVRDRGFAFEAESGQLLLDFDAAWTNPQVDEVSGQPGLQYSNSVPGEAVPLGKLFRELFANGTRNAEVHMRIAAALERDGDLNASLKHLLSAVAIEPENPEVYVRLGLLYRKREDNEAALKSFLKALEYDDDLIEPHRNLAELYEKMGRQREAIRHLSAVHRLTRK